MRKYNYDILEKNAEERPDGVPLVTVCNHTSCLDDPCLWGKRMFVTISVSDQVVSHLTKLRLTIGYTCPLFTTPTALVYCRIWYNIEHDHYGNCLAKEVTKQKKETSGENVLHVICSTWNVLFC